MLDVSGLFDAVTVVSGPGAGSGDASTADARSG